MASLRPAARSRATVGRSSERDGSSITGLPVLFHEGLRERVDCKCRGAMDIVDLGSRSSLALIVHFIR